MRWLAGVRSDLEALGYAVGAADLCAAGAGAPHIRNRLYFAAFRLADAEGVGRGVPVAADERPAPGQGGAPANHRAAGGLADAGGLDRGAGAAGGNGQEAHDGGAAGGLGHAAGVGRGALGLVGEPGEAGAAAVPGAWDDFGIVWCRVPDRGEPIPRRVESGVEPLVDGFRGRLVRTRAYGNAIVPPLAAVFVRAAVAAAGDVGV